MSKNFKRLLFVFAVIAIMTAALAMTVSAETYEVSEGYTKITLDSEGNMSIQFTSTPSAAGWWWEFQPSESNELGKFIDAHRNEVTHIEIDYFKRIQYKGNLRIFEGMTNLVSVHFKDDGNGNGPNFHGSVYDMFNGCNALTTVWVGSAKTENVVDISKLTTNDALGANIFTNCKSLRKIVLMDSANVTELSASMFEGCDALESVYIPASVTAIEEGTFSGLANFKSVIAPAGSAAQQWAEANGFAPSLWERKPASAPLASGYATTGDLSTPSNIKWEYHNLGTDAAPEYALYFFIDEASSNNATTTLAAHRTSQGSPAADNNYYGYGGVWGSVHAASTYTYYNSYYGQAKYISIGDGITALSGACFIGSSAEVVEMPESLKKIEYAPFKNMASLNTVYTRGGEIEAGIADFTNVPTVDLASQYAFVGCASVKEYKFAENTSFGYAMAWACFANNTSLEKFNISTARSDFSIQTDAFANCTSLREITMGSNVVSSSESFATCTALEAIYAPVGSFGHSLAMSKGLMTTHSMVSSDSNVLMVFDPATKSVSFLNNPDYTPSWRHQFSFTDANVQKFANAYKAYAESAFIDSYGKVRSYGTDTLFDGWTLLKEINLKDTSPRLELDSGAYFVKNCDALTTVWCGDESAKLEGVVAIPTLGTSGSYVTELFSVFVYDCASVKKVILPDAAGAITANSFYGCTSLEEIVIPASVTGIADNAFATCTSLRKIELSAPASVVTAGSVSGAKGLVIYTESFDDAAAINSTLAAGNVPTTSAFAFYESGMSISGYSVRTTKYNGLRTHFVFDDTVVSGYDLVEYGSISATADNWAKYSQSYGLDNSVLTFADGEFKTPQNNIVKKPIYMNGEFVNNSVESDEGRSFSVTVVNFSGEQQIKAEIVSVGYEIWEKDGNYYVLFTREDAYGYDTLSLYKTTLGMLDAGVISISMDENDPIWGTLNACEKSEISINDTAITAYTFADPINDGKVIALYLTDSENEVDLTDFGFPMDGRDHISSFIFGKNVKYDLPIVDGYWEEHLEVQIAKIPEGKSFIAYTDTHYDAVRNPESGYTEKVEELVSYVQKRTGIGRVLNLGDPYSGETTVALADEAMQGSVVDDFYGTFGEKGLFAVGNHDANWAAWGRVSNNDSIADGENGLYRYNYFLPDSAIYEYGYEPLVKYHGDKIVFDDEMVALADKLEFTAVGDPNGDNYYSAEDMKAEYIAWAKQHYHFDDETTKIRYISMNTGNCGLVEYYVFDRMYWGAAVSAHFNWLYNALTTTPEGYDIVVMGHMWGSNTAGSGSGYYPYMLLSAFRSGTSFTMAERMSTNANRNVLLTGTPEGSDTITYTFDKAFSGKIFTIGGHWHQDLTRIWRVYGVKDDGSLSYWEWDQEVNYDSNYAGDNRYILALSLESDCIDGPEKTKGNITENSFAVITITDDNRIVVTGFGACASRTINY